VNLANIQSTVGNAAPGRIDDEPGFPIDNNTNGGIS
jgi:hypothetical protein